MLTDLHIQDVVLIENLALSFGPGFTALTGETGAGKSILLDALALALGQRAEARLVRQGAEAARVTAAFEVTAPAQQATMQALFAAHDLPFAQPILLRRVVQRDGKSKAFLNDQPVSLAVLKAVGDALVEIHGQFDTQDLLETKNHRATLDGFAGCDVRATQRAWETWRAALTEQQELAEQLRQAAEKREWLQMVADELRQLNPLPDEEQHLAEQRARMMHAEKILQALHESHDALQGEGGARQRVHFALRSLERMQDKIGPTLAPTLETLQRLAIELDDVTAQLEAQAETMRFDGASQAATDERLFALRGAARKYQTTVAELPQVRATAEDDLRALEDQTERQRAVAQKVTAAEKDYCTAAHALSAQRRAAAEQLARAVMAELPPLKLERAQFVVSVQDKAPAAEGVDAVVFLVAMNAGTPPQPLHKVASGGEMARLMLALKLVTQQTDTVPSLVFDEIDTGVAGAVAEAIGLRLRRLGREAQVFAVTHAPQVAAKAHQHFRIEKHTSGNATRTDVVALSADARVEEIARLLSGETVSAAARTTAQHLLAVEDEPHKPVKKAKRA